MTGCANATRIAPDAGSTAAARGARNGAGRFAREQDGSITVFALVIFVAMLVASGMAIDFMNHERQRSNLQATLDRAVLAAASLNQPLDPKFVVGDYLTKAGLDGFTVDVEVQEGLNFRTVRASASSEVNAIFLKMIGIDSLSLQSSSTAEERISNIEISLVLDLSNSMNSFSRLANLKTAASEFVETILTDDEEGRISISIVPYTGQVNLGPRLAQEYNISDEHSFSHCLELDGSDFLTTGLSFLQPIQRAGHFDPWFTSNPPTMTFCPTAHPSQEIFPFSNNIEVLQTRINSMIADGNTSIDIGMKWGTILLDPGTRPVISNLVASNDVPEEFEGRPYDWDEPDALKIIVLMTDGENFEKFRLKPEYRDGPSNLWVNTWDGNFSLYNPNNGKYHVRHLGVWRDDPWGNGETTNCGWQRIGWNWQWVCETISEPGEAIRLDYPDVWNMMSIRWHADNIIGPAYGNSTRNSWRTLPRTSTNAATKDARLASVCNAAKNAGIIVFGIGFEAPVHGANTVRNCASSPSHYYDVQGLQISNAFNAIAKTIQKLKLVQ